MICRSDPGSMHFPCNPRAACLLIAFCVVVVSLAIPANAAAAAADKEHFQPCAFPNFEDAVQRFSNVLRYKTVSDESQPHHVKDPQPFKDLDAYLETAYSKVWQQLKVERLGDGGFSLLLTWQGSNTALKPALFISHIDVVPVSPGTEQDWTHPPFSGAVAGGYIWGRGTLDVKVGVVGLLEAATALLDQGYQPQRTLLLAFGHDEEVGGVAGAAQIAAKLQAEGRMLEFIWDEGGTVYAEGVPPFTHLPVALVATAEKLYQTVEVTLHSPGGHSSMPPTDDSSIAARLGAFLTAMSAAPPVPRLVSPTREFVEGLFELSAPWLAFLLKISKFLPTALLDKLVAGAMAGANGPTAALVRDTAAMTMLQSGVADNVLPQTAQLAINFRLLPGTPVSDTLQHVHSWLGPNAQHANVTYGPRFEGRSTVTDPNGPAFQLVKQAIQEGWKFAAAAGPRHEGSPVPVLPYLMSGGTDSKHYQNLTHATLRFCPYSLSIEGLKRVHGTNERISLDDFGRLLCTYRAGLRLAGGGAAGLSQAGADRVETA